MADWEVITEGKISGSTTNTIDISSIPATYQHLEITISGRIDQSGSYVPVYSRFNGDSGANYAYAGWASTHTASHAPFRNTAWMGTVADAFCGYATGNNLSSGGFSAMNLIIPNYAETVENKVMLSRGAQGAEDYTDGYTHAMTTGWSSTAAINQVEFYPYPHAGTVYWEAGTSYMLAGYKG